MLLDDMPTSMPDGGAAADDGQGEMNDDKTMAPKEPSDTDEAM